MRRAVSCRSRFICVPARDHLFTIVYSTFAKSYIIVMRFYLTLVCKFSKFSKLFPSHMHTTWRLPTKINTTDFPWVANSSKLPRECGPVHSCCPTEGTQQLCCVWDHLRVKLMGFFCRHASRIIQKLPFSTFATATCNAGTVLWLFPISTES